MYWTYSRGDCVFSGLLLLVLAPKLGDVSYRRVLFQIRHGHIYTTTYEYAALLEAHLVAYRMAGPAVAAVGGVGFLLSGIGVYRELSIGRKSHGQSDDQIKNEHSRCPLRR